MSSKTIKGCDLNERLIDFAVRIINLCNVLPKNRSCIHVSGQLLRSGTAPAPNYAEAQDAESRDDFIHKLKIALKELRETDVWIKLIIRAELIKPVEKLTPLSNECNELISIFVKSIKTARKCNKYLKS